MNQDYVQNLRYKLQKRVRRLNSADWRMFPYSLQQFWSFIGEHEVLRGIANELAARWPEAENDAKIICTEHRLRVTNDEGENAAIAYKVLTHCAQVEPDAAMNVILRVGMNSGSGSQRSEATDMFRTLFLEPFYEYLDEHLDDQRATLALLRRYKHKCEWFVRDHLHRLWVDNTTRGEKYLAMHLYEYLHDQGIDFHIEPTSASGEADLVSIQTGEPLIADVKVFNPSDSRNASYIARGFAQVYRYTLDYNEAVGYLVIFNTSDRDLRFSLSQKEQSTPFVCHNNKTIFFIVVDIHLHDKPASKRGELKTVEITGADLVGAADEVTGKAAVTTPETVTRSVPVQAPDGATSTTH